MSRRKTIQQLREDKGMMQVEVAKAMGISKSRYWKIEHGRRVSLNHALRLAEIFGVRVEDIDFFAQTVPETETQAVTYGQPG